MRNKLAVIAVSFVALIAAACGGSEPASVAAENPSTTRTEVAEPTTVAVDEDSPIESLLGVPVFDDDAMNDWFRELDIERQRLTAECMIRQGFEFVPETAPTERGQGEYATASREYAEAYGFGIGLAFNAAEYDSTASYATANSTYIASLTEGEAEAYEVALNGEPVNEATDAGDADDGFGFDLSGCAGDAFREVFSVLAVMEQLSPVVDGYYEQFQADSRMIALTETWQRCMNEAGFSYSNADTMFESLYPALGAIVGNDAAYEPEQLPEDLPEASFVLNGDVFEFHPRLTLEAQEQLDEFIANEIATAVAHWDCQEPLAEEELAIQREYEAKFVVEAAPLVSEQLGG